MGSLRCGLGRLAAALASKPDRVHLERGYVYAWGTLSECLSALEFVRAGRLILFTGDRADMRHKCTSVMHREIVFSMCVGAVWPAI